MELSSHTLDAQRGRRISVKSSFGGLSVPHNLYKASRVPWFQSRVFFQALIYSHRKVVQQICLEGMEDVMVVADEDTPVASVNAPRTAPGDAGIREGAGKPSGAR